MGLAATYRRLGRPAKVRPSRYPLSVELGYKGLLRGIVAEYRRVALLELERDGPLILARAAIFRLDEAPQATGWAAMVKNLLLRVANGISYVLEAGLNRIGLIAQQVDGVSKTEFRKQVRAAYGIDILRGEPQLADLLSAWTEENAALIKSIPDRLTEQLRSEFTTAFTNGTSLRDLTKIVRDKTGLADNRAELIARDQIGKLTGRLDRMRQESVGVQEYIWRTSQDERVRPTHRVRNDKKFRWDDPGIKPGQEIRCLPGESVVDFSNGCRRIWRRQHSGQATSLVVENGFVLKATPNHPILTNRGWLAINDIEIGDYLICSEFNGCLVSKNNYNRNSSRIDYAFQSLFELGAGRIALCSPSDFHGDVTESNVNVVDFDRMLSSHDMALILKGEYKFRFSATDQARSCISSFKQEISASNHSGGSQISWSMEQSSLFGAKTLPSINHGFTSAALNFSVSFDDPNYNGSGDTENFSQGFNAFSRFMPVNNINFGQGYVSVGGGSMLASGSVNPPSAEQFAQIVRMTGEQGPYLFEGSSLPYKSFRVVKKSLGVFVGHVYNLETATGWYVADNVVMHNCRCTSEPIFPTEFGTNVTRI